MADIDFDDLVPKADAAPASIDFDDLIPAAPKAAAPTRAPQEPVLERRGPGPTGAISQDLYDMGAIARRPTGVDIAVPQAPAKPKPEYQPLGEALKVQAIDNFLPRGRKAIAGGKLSSAETRLNRSAENIGLTKNVGERLSAVGEQVAAKRAELNTATGVNRPTLQAELDALLQQEAELRRAAENPERAAAAEEAARGRLEDAQADRASAQADLDAANADITPTNEEPTALNKALISGISSFGDMAPGLASALVTRNPIPAMLYLLGYSKGSSYADMRTAGEGIDKAQQASSLYALAEALPEYLPLTAILSRAPGFLKPGLGAVAEGASEVLTAGLQVLIDQGVLDKDITWGEAQERMGEGGAAGLVMGTIMGSAGAGYDAATRRRKPEDAAGTPADPNTAPPLPDPKSIIQTAPVAPDAAAALAGTPIKPGMPPLPGLTPPGNQPPAADAPKKGFFERWGKVGDAPAQEPGQSPTDPTGTVTPEIEAAMPRSAADVARDKLKTMRAPVTPEVTPEAPAQTAQESPGAAPTAPVAPTDGEAPPGEVPSVPEAPETIEVQREALRSGNKAAVLYPMGSIAPPELGKGFKRIKLPKVGVIDYDARRFKDWEVRAIVKAGNMNQLLEMGPYNKEDVAASTAAGSPPAGVVERTPEGVEVKAAAGTVATAPEQVEALERAKAAPENTVTVEDPAQVVVDREAAAGVRKPELSEEEKRALALRYFGGSTPNPAAAPIGIAPPAPVTTPVPPVAEQPAAPKAPAKAEAAKAVSKARSAAPAPEVVVTPEGKRQVILPKTAEQQRLIDEAEAKQAAERAKEDKVTTQVKAKAMKANAKTTDIERANRGEITDAQEEARVRRNEDTKDAKRDAAAIANALKVAELQKEMEAKTPERVANEVDAMRVYNRLRKTIERAKAMGITMPGRIQDQHTNAQAWLASVATMGRKLARLEGNVSPETRAEILSDLQAFLADEAVYTFTGDATSLREARKEAGRAVAGKSSELKEEATAATEPDEPPEESTEDQPGDDDTPSNVGVEIDEVADDAPEAKAVEVDPDAPQVTAGKDKAGTFAVAKPKVRVINKPGSKGAAAVTKSRERSAPLAPMERTPGNVSLVPPLTSRGKSGSNGNAAVTMRAAIRAFISGPKGSLARATRYLALRGDLRRSGMSTSFERALAVDTVKLRSILSDAALDARGMTFLAFQDTGRKFTKKEAIMQAAISEHMTETLTKLVGDVDVVVVSDADFGMMMGGTAGYYVGYADGDYIVLPESAMSDETGLLHVVQHEAVHAAIFHVLDKNEALAAKIDKLSVYVKAYAEANDYQGGYYFATNAHEFMSEALSNPKFQKLLSVINLPKEFAEGVKPDGAPAGALKTVLDAVKAIVADIFNVANFWRNMGIKPDSTSAMDAAFDLAAVAFASSADARKMRFGDGAGSAAEQSISLLPAVTRRGKISKIELKLRKLGLNKAQAAEVNAVIRDEFDGKVTDEELKALADAIAAELPAEDLKSKKKLQSTFDGQINVIRQQAEKAAAEVSRAMGEDFSPEKNPGSAWRTLLKLATNDQIAMNADRWFGKKNNPVRTIQEWIERRRVLKSRYMKQRSKILDNLMQQKDKHSPTQWAEFTSLAQDATLANVHPDRSLSENTHLGKNAMRGVHGKARHPELAARYNALPPELQQLYQETRDALTETQNDMTIAVIRNILAQTGHTDEAMVTRFHEGKATAADYRAVGNEVANHIEAAGELRKIEGPYFNLVRRGDWVVRGKYKLTPPGNAKVLAPNMFQFPTREEAEAYMQTQELHSDLRKVWVDKDTGERFGIEKDGSEVKISKQDGVDRYVVTVQNEHVEFVDSEREAAAVHKALTADGLEMRSYERTKYKPQASNSDMLSSQMLAVRKAVQDRNPAEGLSDVEKARVNRQNAELGNALNEISLRFLAGTRIQSSRLPRRNVQGADADLIRNTFDYVDSASGYLAKLDTALPMHDALLELERRIDEMGKLNNQASMGARDISNEIEKRVYAPIPGEDEGSLNNFVQRSLSLSFLYTLFSPAYSIINSMQVAQFTLPMLSADFNPASATYQINKAYRDIGALGIAGTGLADTGRAFTGKIVNADKFIDTVKRKLTPDEKRMIDYMADVGVIDADGGLEIARMIDRQKNTVGGYLDSGIQYMDNIARAMPGAVEAINRSVTAIAAYRMKMKETKDHEASVQYARDMISKTQGLMSNSNAAPIFTHPAGRIALQMKKFGQMTYYLLGNQLNRVFYPMAPGERRKGAMALAYVVAATQVFAGSLGMPVEPLRIAVALFNAMGWLDDSWEDWQDKIAEAYAEITGSDTLGDMLAFGVSRGLPGGWAFDTQGRMGLSDIAIYGEPNSGKEADVKSWLLDQLMGVSGGYGSNIVQSADDLLSGNFDKALAGIVPFKMARDALSAADGAASGKMEFEDVVLKVLGFTSARTANINRQRGADIRASQKATQARNDFYKDYKAAANAGERAKIISKLKDYNASLTKEQSRLKISPKSLEKARLEDMEPYESN